MTGIGPRLREARTREGLSLRALAADLGVTAALLSQIETGRTQPSVSTLYLLVGRLGISLDWLLGVEPAVAPARPSVVLRADEHPVVQIEHGVRWELVAPSVAGGHDLVHVTYEPGAAGSPDDRLVAHEGREAAYLIDGELVLLLADARHVLRAGDSLDFDAATPHGYRNEGSVPARGVWLSAGAAHPA
jgi:transcriptional regulator with XRE-family HTH domain